MFEKNFWNILQKANRCKQVKTNYNPLYPQLSLILCIGRYIHPDMGQCLTAIAEKNMLIRGELQRHARRRKSNGQSSSHHSSSHQSSNQTTSHNSERASSKCPMRYGIATGHVMAGVLPGKCPLFDVWGKSVNLACRMEVDVRMSYWLGEFVD